MKKLSNKKIAIIVALIGAVALIIAAVVQGSFGSKGGETNSASNSGINSGLIVGKLEIHTEVGVLEAKIYMNRIFVNEPVEDGYQSEFLLSVETEVPIKNLYIQANAEDVIKMDVIPQRTGAANFGHSGTRDEFAFTNIENVYGEYQVRLLTETPQKITFELSNE
jgi:hypothetical protein